MADEAAEQRFERIYRDYERPVYAYFRRRTDPVSAEDGAAETFLVAWRRLDEVPEGDAALLWLYATARRVLSNSRRAGRRFARLVGRVGALAVADPPRPETVVVRREADQEVVDALNLLRAGDRELLRLAVWEEVPREELAVMYRCSPHAVSQRLNRATGRLGRHLAAGGHRRSAAAGGPTQRGSAG